MRTDESGNQCPSTLREYRSLCVTIGGKDCKAVKYLDESISFHGIDAEVLSTDSQMRSILLPMLVGGYER
jgi:hypothetical protein